MGESKRRAVFEASMTDAQRYKRGMIDVVKHLDGVFNGAYSRPGMQRGTLFMLMAFPAIGHNGKCNWFANGVSRDDAIRIMREQIAFFEAEAAALAES